MDIEDSHKLRILSFEETRDLLLGFFDENTKHNILQRLKDEEVTDENEQIVYFRACAVGKLEHGCVKAFVDHEEEILNGTLQGSLIDNIAEPQREAYRACSKVSYKKIYHSKPVLDVELSGYKIMETLMRTFIGANSFIRRSSTHNSSSTVSPVSMTSAATTLRRASWRCWIILVA